MAGGCRMGTGGEIKSESQRVWDKPWLAPRLWLYPDVIGAPHREADIHSGYRQSTAPLPSPIHRGTTSN